LQEIAKATDEKAYADAFVEAEIATSLPFQIRALRKARNWSQQALAERTGQHQKTISDFENPNYGGKYAIASLLRLASVFDVALIVRFAPMSDLVDWAANLSSEKIKVPERTKDARLKAQKRGVALNANTAVPVAQAAKEDTGTRRILVGEFGASGKVLEIARTQGQPIVELVQVS
jgi:transcriptional regulator with XRE-family HTH domain